jgi:hypothetical protein
MRLLLALLVLFAGYVGLGANRQRQITVAREELRSSRLPSSPMDEGSVTMASPRASDGHSSVHSAWWLFSGRMVQRARGALSASGSCLSLLVSSPHRSCSSSYALKREPTWAASFTKNSLTTFQSLGAQQCKHN